jgi:hypothetical protein
MKADSSSPIESRKMIVFPIVILGTIILGLIAVHIFLPQDPFAYLIFSFLIVIVTAGSLGSIIADKKDRYSSKILILVCLLIAAVCFSLSFLGFTRKPVIDPNQEFRTEKFIRTERYGAIVLLITGIVYLLIPVILKVWNRRKKSIQSPLPDIKEAKQ